MKEHKWILLDEEEHQGCSYWKCLGCGVIIWSEEQPYVNVGVLYATVSEEHIVMNDTEIDFSYYSYENYATEFSVDCDEVMVKLLMER